MSDEFVLEIFYILYQIFMQVRRFPFFFIETK
jgi:hypothetical protein